MSVGLTRPTPAAPDENAPRSELPLQVVDVGMRFGGTVALTEVSLHVSRRERVGLIGPNGAGKTTLLEIISGMLRPSEGKILRFGRDVTGVPAESRARAGIGRTFQHSSRFSALTAAESVAIAILAHRHDHPFSRGLAGQRRVFQAAMSTSRDLLGELGAESHADAPAADLPLGIARLVDIARAISGQPDLLLLDEPSSGLDDRERDRLTSFLAHHVAESESAFLLVEHDVEFVRSLCERLVVLDFGAKIADAPTAQALRDPAVRSAYLGLEEPAEPPPTPVRAADRAAVAAPAPAGAGTSDAPPPTALALELRDVSAGYGRSPVLSEISLSVPTGVAVAVLGPNGAGKTTLARLITGQLRPTAGRLLLHGHDVTGSSAASLARLGVFHVPDSRAIYPSLTVRENLVMAFRFRIDRRRVNDSIDRVIELFPALGRHLGTRAGMLSGGEQQMLALAPAIAEPPSVLVLDELSHGLSPLVVGRLFDILATVGDEVTTVVIEQFAERALALADQVIALRRGRIAFQGPTAGVTSDDVASWYALEG